MKKKLLTIAIVAVMAMAFTACNRGKGASSSGAFSIYGLWRYTGSADVEHGETWYNEGANSISIYKDGENCIVASGNAVWRGFLHEGGDFGFTFNAQTRLDLETGAVHNAEGQGP